MGDETAARARRRPTADQRRIERARIAEQWLAGFGLVAIAEAQKLRTERVRRIIREIREIGPAGRQSDFALLQLDRLRPALRAAMVALDRGNLAAVPRLIKVMDMMDRYEPVAYQRTSAGRDAGRLVAGRDKLFFRPRIERFH